MTAAAARVEPPLSEYDAAASAGADQLAESLLGAPVSRALRAPAFRFERGNASIGVHFSLEARWLYSCATALHARTLLLLTFPLEILHLSHCSGFITNLHYTSTTYG